MTNGQIAQLHVAVDVLRRVDWLAVAQVIALLLVVAAMGAWLPLFWSVP